MKILLINDFICNKGGAEKVVDDLKKLLEEQGFEVRLFGSLSGEEGGFTFFSRWFSLNNFFSVLKIIHTFKPDLIHAHNVSRVISPSALVAAKILSIPAVMTFHDYHLICPKTWMIYSDGLPCNSGFSCRCLYSNCKTFYNGYRFTLYNIIKWVKVLLHRFIINNTVNVIICPNTNLLSWVKKSFKVDCEYLPNFCDIKLVKLNRDPKYFLYVGRLSPEKGIFNLVNEFKSIKNEKLVIIGDGPDRDAIREFITKNNINNVTLLGKIDNSKLSKYYSEAFSTIIPSACMENNPLVALESLAFGTPIIVSKRGGLPDFVSNGAICVTYDNHSELLSAIEYMKRCKEIVKLPMIYSSEEYTNKLLKIYSNLTLQQPTNSP